MPLLLETVPFVQLSALPMRYEPSLSSKYSKFAFAKACVSVLVSEVSSSSLSVLAQAAKINTQKESTIRKASSSVAIRIFLVCLL